MKKKHKEDIARSALGGRVRVYNIADGRKVPLTPWISNLVLFDWAGITGRLLTQGDTNYKIGGMYLEYENVADPADPVAVPTFDRSGGLSYYAGLAGSPTKDYLRVPLTSAILDSSNLTNFPDGNRMTFFAQSQGVTGVNGKAFSDSVNSKVYGAGLVTLVDEADSSRDIVFSRFYLPVASQQVKLPTSQVGLEWEIELQ
jgi:hypothetical protein